MAGKRKPWDMRDDESEEAFAHFTVYRDLDPLERSIGAASALAGRARRVLETHSANHDWVARARAWDRRKDQARTNRQLTEIERMNDRHRAYAAELQDMATLELERRRGRIERAIKRAEESETGEDPLDVNPLPNPGAELERGIKLERLATGEATERTESSHDLSALSTEELKQFRELCRKVKRQSGED
jgi:hypothetical protein